MADYESSRSEGGFKASFRVGGGPAIKPANFVQSVASKNEQKTYMEENKLRNEERYGSKRDFYLIGRDARLSGRNYEPLKDDKEAEESYRMGYINGGNEQLEMTANNRMTELVTRARYGFGDADYDAKKCGFPTRKEFASSKTPEYLYDIGYIDGSNGIIEFDELPEAVKNNPNYVEGFEEAIRKVKKGR